MRDGAFRAASFLHQVSTGELPATFELGGSSGETDGGLRLTAMQLAAVVFVVALLIPAADDRAQFGVNLFTAEILLVVAAAITLFRTIRRLTEQR